MTTTENVLDHHVAALLAGDLEAILADYGETSVLATPDMTVRGLPSLREFFASVIADLLQPGSQIEETTRAVEGEFAYIVWRGESEKFRFPFATDTFVVRNGKIVFQSFAGQVEPK
jgi:hypothetical protein